MLWADLVEHGYSGALLWRRPRTPSSCPSSLRCICFLPRPFLRNPNVPLLACSLVRYFDAPSQAHLIHRPAIGLAAIAPSAASIWLVAASNFRCEATVYAIVRVSAWQQLCSAGRGPASMCRDFAPETAGPATYFLASSANCFARAMFSIHMPVNCLRVGLT